MKHFYVGVIALVLGVCGIVAWWDEFGDFLRGFVPVVIILLGIAAIGAGIRKGPSTAESEDAQDPNASPPSDEGQKI